MLKLIKFNRDGASIAQKGDTIIEVVIASAIIAATLTGALKISGRASRLGQAAKERTQAVGLIQGQAEALRNLRDNKVKVGGAGWNSFINDIGPVGLCSSSIPDRAPDAQSFYLAKSGSGWLKGGANQTTEGLFTVFIEACDDTDTALHAVGSKIRFDITAQWELIGGGPVEKTTITTHLVNTQGIRGL